MARSGQDIIEFGITLLREHLWNVSADVAEAFRLAGVRESELTLAALKSPFGGDMYFKPAQLSVTAMNYPDSEAPPDFSCVEPGEDEHGLTALEKYGSFVATNANESLPVCHLFKTAAAIQDCLLADGDSEKPFLLVSADFSGIQDTVYTISSKGALKTLRARSFMLELLTEHIVYEILHSCQAERQAIIYSGGGGFSLLLPNRAGVVTAIEGYREVLNRWALQEFSGKFFIALDATPCNAASLESEADFTALRQCQSESLDKLKRQKFLKQLDELFTPTMPKQLTTRTECQITRRDDLLPEKMRDREKGTFMSSVPHERRDDDCYTWLSESCFHQFRLGDKLIDAKKVYRYEEKPDKDKIGYLTLKGINDQDVYYSIDKIVQKDADVWQINSWESTSPTVLYAQYVRKHGELSDFAKEAERESIESVEGRTPKNDDTATFEGLASSSCGADLIGALRMDVDDMGKMFSKIASLPELSVKSRMLNLFFKVYLNEICAGNLGKEEKPTDIVGKNYQEKNPDGTNKGRNVSVVYVGGDDLFILGAWDETAELAFDIQRCFACFTGGSFDSEKKGCGISGGLTLHQPKFPLYQMAQKSGEAEHVAKNDKDTIYGDIEKNRIALFYDDSKYQRRLKMKTPERYRYMLSMTWNLSGDFLIPLMKTYCECGSLKSQDGRLVLEIDKFSYQTIEKWFAVIEKYQESYMLYLPTMARVMKQVEEGKNMNADLFKKLFSYLYTNEESKKNWISHLHIALNWLSFLRRTK
ncbi:type III-A CRISPR-associated protein Cas10/Csm1 [Chlorobaculum limnaeum]|uniref:CRISPR system single-strand-specific deoxyribonuclease Cas10/Csm1 (subtype III-A) n=1 Tax=Chlorobaculum limnaeum TaxID=274537 RepID=A0A1D8D3D0_CHLLM|nr:type III-A CRISPR-associated protein Cas10/Csm1 [Chlorobaculum limnaeum]AOS83487.1 type III-A CRISPR-associated protein Cas10/Csm1 [Chlorobaculum limnaeum]